MKDKPSIDEIPCTRELIFNYLVQYKEEHDGNSPTNRQIAEACHVSPSTVSHHLARLERANRIRLSEDEYRNIEIVGGQWTRPRARSTPGEPDTGGQEDEKSHSIEAEHLSDHPPQITRAAVDHRDT
jgi:DNA-binding transcriptional ArsR family regulator